MRVFFALTFWEKDKKRITEYRDLVANGSIKGRFTREDNFHMTLMFMGQVSAWEVDSLCEILEDLYNDLDQGVGFDPLIVDHIGSFPKRDREILWLGIRKHDKLKKLQKDLVRYLLEQAFQVEKRKYTPHITLGRQVLMKDLRNEFMVKPYPIPIKGIALMESKNIGGQLVYEPVEELIFRSV